MFTTAFNLLSYSQKDLLKKCYSTKHLQINLGNRTEYILKKKFF